jgi:glutathione S-transferase
MKVYGDLRSGNCLKVKLLLSFLTIEHEWLHVSILDGETKSLEFLAKNPNGKIPIVELDDGCYLSESNAILGYFADNTAFLPTERYQKAKVYEWLFFEQYSHEPYIAVRCCPLYSNLFRHAQSKGSRISCLTSGR